MTQPIPAEQADYMEHLFRSLRGWLHGLFPAQDIFIQRDESTESTRPALRMELVSGPGFEEAAAGWSWMTATIIVHYAATVGDNAQWDAQRAAGKIRSAAVRPRGRIPMSLYNLVWPQPPEITVAATSGGTLPAALDVAVAAVSGSGGSQASAPSEPLQLAVPAGNTIGVRPRNWPTGRPLAASWEVYAAIHGQPLKLQGTVAEGGTFVLSALASGAAAPTNRRLASQGIRVMGIDVVYNEQSGQERTMDAAVTLRLQVPVPITTDAQMDSSLV